MLAFEAPLSIIQNIILGKNPEEPKDSDFTSEADQTNEIELKKANLSMTNEHFQEKKDAKCRILL